MATQQELEQFLAGTTPSERRRLFRKDQERGTVTDLDELARGGPRPPRERTASFVPGPGPGLATAPTRPAQRLPFPEQKSKIDVSGSGASAAAASLLPDVPEVEERFLDETLQAQTALEDFIARGPVRERVGQGRGRGVQFKDPRTTAEYAGLAQRRNLFRKLATEGTFAEQENAKRPLRQAQAAEALLAGQRSRLAGKEFENFDVLLEGEKARAQQLENQQLLNSRILEFLKSREQ